MHNLKTGKVILLLYYATQGDDHRNSKNV